jgi:hypothetical protein
VRQYEEAFSTPYKYEVLDDDVVGFRAIDQEDFPIEAVKGLASIATIHQLFIKYHTVRLIGTRPLLEGLDEAGLFVNFTSLEGLGWNMQNLESSLTMK